MNIANTEWVGEGWSVNEDGFVEKVYESRIEGKGVRSRLSVKNRVDKY